MKQAISALAIAFFLVSSAFGQAAATPATSPATTQRAPHKLVLPNGFKIVNINGRNVVVEPADEAWVTAAMGKMPATTKPATQPAVMLAKLRGERENIIRAMMADLATKDPVPLAKDYDTVLTPSLKSLDALRPPVFYL